MPHEPLTEIHPQDRSIGKTESPVDRASKRPVVASIERLARVVRARHREDRSALRLSDTQSRILSFVSQASPGDATARAIAREVGVAAATVSEAVQRLETRGLIVRYPDDADHRRIWIRPTSAGRTQAAELGRWVDSVRKLVAEWPQDEVHAIELFLSELVRELDG
jgi:DNA-binding MarR family transcriptional regulator